MDFSFQRRRSSKGQRRLNRWSNYSEPALEYAGMVNDLSCFDRPAASDFLKPRIDEEAHGANISSTSAERNQSDRRLCRQHTGQTQQRRTGGAIPDQPVPQLAAYRG